MGAQISISTAVSGLHVTHPLEQRFVELVV